MSCGVPLISSICASCLRSDSSISLRTLPRIDMKRQLRQTYAGHSLVQMLCSLKFSSQIHHLGRLLPKGLEHLLYNPIWAQSVSYLLT